MITIINQLTAIYIYNKNSIKIINFKYLQNYIIYITIPLQYTIVQYRQTQQKLPHLNTLLNTHTQLMIKSTQIYISKSKSTKYLLILTFLTIMLIVQTQTRYRPAQPQPQPNNQQQQPNNNNQRRQQSPIEILGFEAWQDPSPQQLKSQFVKLTQQYKANLNKDAAAQQKYNKIKSAFQELKNNNFGSSSSSQSYNTNNRNQRESRYHSTNQQNMQYNNRRARHSGFYSRSYEPQYHSQYKLNLQELLNNLNFMTFENQHQSGQGIYRLDFFDFLIWLGQNPMIIIAGALISVGLINFCAFCCCCCCCKLCKKKDQKQEKNKNVSTSTSTLFNSNQKSAPSPNKKIGSYQQIQHNKNLQNKTKVTRKTL